MLPEKTIGKPYAGNPHVRFDEGEGSADAWSADSLPRRPKGLIPWKSVT